MKMPKFVESLNAQWAYSAPELVAAAPVYVEIGNKLVPVTRLSKAVDENGYVCLVISHKKLSDQKS